MTDRTVSPLRWALLGTTMTAIGGVGVATAAPTNGAASFKMAQAESGEAGESGEAAATSEAGEAGESGAAATQEDSDTEFLADIGFMKGYALVGYQLFKQGHADMAKTHLKLPDSEKYQELVPELKERDAPEFATQLTALSDAVAGGDAGGADAAYTDLVAMLETAAETVAEPDHAKLRAIVKLTADAAEDYAAGVKDGKLTDAHEYQDAWAYIQISKAYAQDLTTSSDAKVAKAAQKAAEQLDALAGSFKGLVPPEDIGTDPADLYVAAARIEFAVVAAH